jgi:hypothetical protein
VIEREPDKLQCPAQAVFRLLVRPTRAGASNRQ